MENVKPKRNGWKVVGIAAIIIIFIFLALKGCGHILSKIPSVPDEYVKKVQTGGDY